VNSGGEPERDDTGLPPVDIEIPDDARELDRDVQAYYREQRAERRRLRHRRLHGAIARDGILLPLLACCLILALITGTLLTVFSATSDQNLILPGGGTATSRPHSSASSASGLSASGTATSRPAAHRPATSGPAPSAPASTGAPSGGPSTSPASSAGSSAGSGGSAPASSPAVVQTGAPLPAGTLGLAGHSRQVSLRNLGETMLVLVPPACGCSAAVNWLAGIGAIKHVPTYLVGTRQTISEAGQLHTRLSASLKTAVSVALDKQGVLAHTYPVKGLTAVIVTGQPAAGQSAAYAQHLSMKDKAEPLVRALGG
jgi:hypothetical protein